MIGTFRKLHWTEHVKAKMRQYGLSKSKLMGVLKKPERKEEGIALGTVALMQSNKMYGKPKSIAVGTTKSVKKNPGEIWLMYSDDKNFRRIISAWRYPGISKPGETIPIPEDIRQELFNNKV